MLRFFLLFLFLAGCAVSLPPEPNTVWKQSHWQDNAGIVSLSTSWGKSHLCTGVLIAPQMVLSAAHCTLHASDTFVVYGCNDIRSSHCTRVQVKSIHNHPKYKMSYESGNDIAIFITEKPIDLSLIKFASKNYNKNDKIKVVGFGRRNNKNGILYQGYGVLKNEYRYELTALLKKGMDPNPGDSGGPALVMEDGEYKLLGILSRVKLTRTKKKNYINSGVGIYTKVRAYQNWIWSNNK
jgi:secreted trypsin-like serine protease